MKIYLLLLAVLIGIHATAQTYSSKISDDEILGFMNWLTIEGKRYSEEPKLGKRKVMAVMSPWNIEALQPNGLNEVGANTYEDFSPFNQYEFTDAYFSEEDREFVLEQFHALNDSVWRSPFGKSKLISGNVRKENTLQFSVPMFSKDYNYVIIHKSYYCGNFCAYGGYSIYEKNKSQTWKLVKTAVIWVS